MAHMNKSNTYTEKVTAKFLIRRKELFFDSKIQLTHYCCFVLKAN